MSSSNPIDALNAQFAIPGVAEIIAGNGGLPKVRITTPAASAEIYLHGAHLTSWKPAGHQEVIFLSRQSHFQDGKAIRGGIPICFPWFRAKSDNPKAPSHGFVRTRSWGLNAIAQNGENVTVTLTTQTDESTRQLWPFDCTVSLRFIIGAELKLELTVANTGSESFHFEEALHTYHLVADAANLPIAGLDGVAYLDNRDGNQHKLQSGDVHFTQATDNAYIDTEAPVVVHDAILRRSIRLDKLNSLTTVVWNPWQDGAATLSDMADDEWRQMACVEASNILGSAITLAPGAEHTISAIISVAPYAN